MSRFDPQVPENVKTLFLRNLESFLVIEGCMRENDIPSIRKFLFPDMLNLLNDYVDDIQNSTNSKMYKTYIKDCIRDRFFNECSILDNNR